MKKYIYTLPNGEQIELSAEQVRKFASNPQFDKTRLGVEVDDSKEQKVQALVDNGTWTQEEADLFLSGKKEEFLSKSQGRMGEETKEAFIDAYQEEDPYGKAFAPRTAEAVASGEGGAGEAVLDLASAPYRASLSLANTLFEDVGTGLGLRNAPEGTTEDRFLEGMEVNRDRSDYAEGGYGDVEQFVTEGVTAPENIVPFGVIAQPAKAMYSGLTKAMPFVDDAVKYMLPNTKGVASAKQALQAEKSSLASEKARLMQESYAKSRRIDEAKRATELAEQASQEAINKARADLVLEKSKNQGIQGARRYLGGKAQSLLERGGEEMAIEAGRQKLAGEDNLESIAFAGLVPTAIQGAGRASSDYGRKLLKDKLQLPTIDVNTRYPANTDVLLEQDLVPSRGGVEGIYSNLTDKIDEVGGDRSNALIDSSRKRAQAEQQMLNAKTEDEFLNAEEIYEENSISKEAIRNNALGEVYSQRATGDMKPDEADKIAEAIEKEMERFEPFSYVPYTNIKTDFLPIDVVKNADANWFKDAQINRQLTNSDPQSINSRMAQIMYDTSRKLVNESPAMSQTSQEFAKLLPLEKAIGKKVNRGTTGQLTGQMNKGLFSTLQETNPFVTTAYKGGKRLEQLGNVRGEPTRTSKIMMSGVKERIKEEEEEE